jgi:SAM-dependent methyltransferase
MKRLYLKHRVVEEARDLDAVVATFDDECFLQNVALGTRASGREAVVGGAAVTEWLINALAVRAGETVLELAAGAGAVGFELFARHPGVRLISTDVSPATLDVARRAAARRGLSGIEFHVVDAQRMDIASASADAVICRWGYMLMEDPTAAFRETARVLRLDGRLALSVWGDPARNPWTTIDADVCARLGYVPPAPPTAPGGIFSLADPARLRWLVEESGLEVRRLEPVPVMWPYASEDDYVAIEIGEIGRRAEYLHGLPHADQRRALSFVGELLEPYRTDTGYLVPGETLNVLAVNPAA